MLPAPYSNNMLYPKEDRERKQLMYVCEFCEHTEPADDPCVSRTVIKHTAEYVCSLRQRERVRAREREKEREREKDRQAKRLHLLMVCTCSWCAPAHGLHLLMVYALFLVCAVLVDFLCSADARCLWPARPSLP